MPIDDKGDPWSGTTYRGFSGGRGAAAAAEPKAPRRPPSRALMLGGVAGALALGVAGGLVLRPELIGSKPPPTVASAPTQAAKLAPPGAEQVPIAVNPPPAPEPVPRAPGKLQTLPPEMAAAARAQVAPPTITIQPPVAEAPTVEVPQAAPAENSEPAPAPRYRASFDCSTARPGAEEMVCSDPSLAAADRQLARAYRRAMASGIEPADLRQEQRDWVAIREDAARRSPNAVAEVYDQRIRELNEIADSAPEPVE